MTINLTPTIPNSWDVFEAWQRAAGRKLLALGRMLARLLRVCHRREEVAQGRIPSRVVANRQVEAEEMKDS